MKIIAVLAIMALLAPMSVLAGGRSTGGGNAIASSGDTDNIWVNPGPPTFANPTLQDAYLLCQAMNDKKCVDDLRDIAYEMVDAYNTPARRWMLYLLSWVPVLGSRL